MVTALTKDRALDHSIVIIAALVGADRSLDQPLETTRKVFLLTLYPMLLDHSSYPDVKNVKTNRSFRIAYITVGLPGASPAEAFFSAEIGALLQRGYHLMIVPRESRGGTSQIVWPEQQFVAKVVGLASPEVLWQFVKTAARDWRLVLRVLRDCCLDTTWSNTLKNIRVLPKGLWLGELVKAQSIDHIHAQWGATTATLGEIAHRVSGVPWSFTLHRGDIVQNNRLEQKARSAAFTRFISLSGVALYERVTGSSVTSARNVKVIHMGVAVPAEDALDPVAYKAPFSIICPARLLAVKGHIFLLEAMELLKTRGMDVQLFVAGDGVLRAELEAWVGDHGLRDHVTFLGRQNHDVLLAGYRKRQFQAVVLASVDLGNGVHEGIPVSLMEGMAFGLPVVATDTGGIPELLYGGAGIIVPAQDPERLADAIASLAKDPELASETARQGRERVLSEFNITRVVDALSEAFEAST